MTEDRKIYPLSTPIKDVEWHKTTFDSRPDTLFTCYIEGGHRLTVLDRETRCVCGGIRDVETGLLHADSGWWLASGQRDVRLAPEVDTLEDAIAWVIGHANNCCGG